MKYIERTLRGKPLIFGGHVHSSKEEFFEVFKLDT